MAPTADLTSHAAAPAPAPADAPVIAAPEDAVLTVEEALRAKFAHLDNHINHYPADILQILHMDGMISLAGGLPHPSLFPFDSLHVSAYEPSTRMATNPTEIAKVDVCVEKKPSSYSTNLSTTLQYGPFNEIKPVMDWMSTFIERVYAPGYSDWQLLMDGGSTDGWAKIAGMLLKEGDNLLVETHTFPSAQAMWVPMGVNAVPVDIDMYGLRPDALARTLEFWETERPGERKPKVLYCVPVGHNPTGSTLSADRKQQIYDICVKHDVVIVEDDLYYFLQLPTYEPDGSRELAPSGTEPEACLARLTVSKTLAPGFRLGFIVSNPLFHERLARATEVLTQAASGWSQTIFSELIHTWGQDGYIRWLEGISETYTVRRNWMCDSLAAHFDVDWDDVTAVGVLTYQKDAQRTVSLFRFVPPTSGMFLWLDLDLQMHPAWEELSKADCAGIPGEEVWAAAFWRKLLDARVLLAPGTYTKPWQDASRSSAPTVRGHAFFRLTYSSTPRDEMDEGIRRLASEKRRRPLAGEEPRSRTMLSVTIGPQLDNLEDT
ncbi:pyridoxal phosphate-dependent transferase [Schizophyllum amplum]|uniref:Pyridoxal phosphate-dependent transferase n=1 Tax=Schizophyllum amplum TaxID=97359 RepID=A0A550CIU6_9AGAR|nr:pyridoxal phosphate-dependent transferase [Auriculariopsis ampla]